MSGRTYTIGEVAKSLELDAKNNSTVRLWTGQFTDWLSPHTRPVKGQLRLYTEEDVRCLTIVRDLRRRHIPYEEVRTRLSAGSVVRPEMAEEVAVMAPLPEAKPEAAALGAEEMRVLLSPVFEVTEALRRFVKDSDYVVGIHQELGRLASAVVSLNAKIDLLRYDLAALRRESQTPEPSSPGKSTGGATEDISPMPGSGQSRASRGSAGTDGSDRSDWSVASGNLAQAPGPAQLATVAEEGSGAQPGLNEYGLRPIPEWLVGQSLSAAHLCRLCGSTTKPLGVTPTARVVLQCIECRERLTVPLTRLEADLGLRRGFWSRLWQALRHPLSRRR